VGGPSLGPRFRGDDGLSAPPYFSAAWAFSMIA
jgi:hypothetical protein